VHEMIGVGGQEARHGVPFAHFFACDAGTTPADLLNRGIYKDIAVGLKGGEWRVSSMKLLAQALTSRDPAAEDDPEDLEKRVQARARLKSMTNAVTLTRLCSMSGKAGTEASKRGVTRETGGNLMKDGVRQLPKSRDSQSDAPCSSAPPARVVCGGPLEWYL
jgi:hypothetical protein